MSEHRLNEIVIERPRGGMRCSLKKMTGVKKHLNAITQEATEDGLLRPYLIKPRNKTKYLSDHLSPLRRFLRLRRGQPWSQVYSELCQRLDHSTMTGQHVLDHVKDYVEEHVEFINGIPYSKSRSWKNRLDWSYHDQFYVHPETGILCLAKPSVPQPKKPSVQPDYVTIDDYHQYRKIDGIWYHMTFENFPPTDEVYDLLKGKLQRKNAATVRAQPIYAARKRQCNKREVRSIQNSLMSRIKAFR
jgi:hypothetical protein